MAVAVWRDVRELNRLSGVKAALMDKSVLLIGAPSIGKTDGLHQVFVENESNEETLLDQKFYNVLFIHDKHSSPPENSLKFCFSDSSKKSSLKEISKQLASEGFIIVDDVWLVFEELNAGSGKDKKFFLELLRTRRVCLSTTPYRAEKLQEDYPKLFEDFVICFYQLTEKIAKTELSSRLNQLLDSNRGELKLDLERDTENILNASRWEFSFNSKICGKTYKTFIPNINGLFDEKLGTLKNLSTIKKKLPSVIELIEKTNLAANQFTDLKEGLVNRLRGFNIKPSQLSFLKLIAQSSNALGILICLYGLVYPEDKKRKSAETFISFLELRPQDIESCEKHFKCPPTTLFKLKEVFNPENANLLHETRNHLQKDFPELKGRVEEISRKVEEILGRVEQLEKDKMTLESFSITLSNRVNLIELESKKSIPEKEKLNIEDFRIEYILKPTNEESPEFFRQQGPIGIDFKQGYVIERPEVSKILERIENERVLFVKGNPASGKSVVLRNVGFNLLESRGDDEDIYYLELKKDVPSQGEVNTISNGVLLIEDGHLNVEYVEKIIRGLKSNENVKIIISTRKIDSEFGPTDPRVFPTYLKRAINLRSDSVTWGIIDKFSKKKNLKVGSIREKLNRQNLWILVWQLRSFEEQGKIDDYSVYNTIKDHIRKDSLYKEKKELQCEVENVLLPLSILYQYEIPVLKNYVQGFAPTEVIEKLIERNEINKIEKDGVEYLTLFHSEIAKMYVRAFLCMRGLGETAKEKYREKENWITALPYEYFTEFPRELIEFFTESHDLLDEETLITILSENRENLVVELKNEIDIASIGRFINKCEKIKPGVGRTFFEQAGLEIIAKKIKQEEDIPKIVRFIIPLIKVDRQLSESLISLVINKLAEKVKEHDMSMSNLGYFFHGLDYKENKILGYPLIRTLGVEALAEKIKYQQGYEQISDLKRFLLSIYKIDPESAISIIRLAKEPIGDILINGDRYDIVLYVDSIGYTGLIQLAEECMIEAIRKEKDLKKIVYILPRFSRYYYREEVVLRKLAINIIKGLGAKALAKKAKKERIERILFLLHHLHFRHEYHDLDLYDSFLQEFGLITLRKKIKQKKLYSMGFYMTKLDHIDHQLAEAVGLRAFVDLLVKEEIGGLKCMTALEKRTQCGVWELILREIGIEKLSQIILENGIEGLKCTIALEKRAQIVVGKSILQEIGVEKLSQIILENGIEGLKCTIDLMNIDIYKYVDFNIGKSIIDEIGIKKLSKIIAHAGINGLNWMLTHHEIDPKIQKSILQEIGVKKLSEVIMQGDEVWKISWIISQLEGVDSESSKKIIKLSLETLAEKAVKESNLKEIWSLTHSISGLEYEYAKTFIKLIGPERLSEKIKRAENLQEIEWMISLLGKIAPDSAKTLIKYSTNSPAEIIAIAEIIELSPDNVQSEFLDTLSTVDPTLAKELKKPWITDKLAIKWLYRPLTKAYAVVYTYTVGNHLEPINIVFGLDLEGREEVLDIWIREEHAEILSSFTNLKNRGVEEILTISVNYPQESRELIKGLFPYSDIQGGIIDHKTATRYVSYEDRKAFCKDLKAVYIAPSKDAGLATLERFRRKWNKKYGCALKKLGLNRSNVTKFLGYPKEIRCLMYAMKSKEKLSIEIEKITYEREHFSEEEFKLKLIFVAKHASKEWSTPINKWDKLMNPLQTYYGKRINKYLTQETGT